MGVHIDFVPTPFSCRHETIDSVRKQCLQTHSTLAIVPVPLRRSSGQRLTPTSSVVRHDSATSNRVSASTSNNRKAQPQKTDAAPHFQNLDHPTTTANSSVLLTCKYQGTKPKAYQNEIFSTGRLTRSPSTIPHSETRRTPTPLTTSRSLLEGFGGLLASWSARRFMGILGITLEGRRSGR